MQTYFDMRPHLRGPHANLIREGMNHLCSERYSDRKRRFKNKWFVERQGFDHAEEIRRFPPPNTSSEEWNKHVDYTLNEENRKRSTINQENRSKQKYPSLHGSRSRGGNSLYNCYYLKRHFNCVLIYLFDGFYNCC